MAKLKLYNVLGKDFGTITLKDDMFIKEPHNQAMFDVVLSERASYRSGNHSTKTRGEVRGGGKKPWRQKGTGRARHGSIRSPIWRGGGVIFGPTPNRNYELKVNKKVREKAYKSAWTVKKNDIYALDKLEFDSPSTHDFLILLKNLKLEGKKILFISDINDMNTWKSSLNIPTVLTTTYDYILVEDILNADAILITKLLLEKIEERLVK